MKRWTVLVAVMLTMVLAGSWSATSYSQDAPDRPNRRQAQDERPRRRGGNFNREAFRARFEGMIQDRLGATDKEWAVLKPRIRKVQDLRAGGFRGMGRLFFGRRGRGGRGGRGGGFGPPPLGDDAPASLRKMVDATDKLGDLVENDAPSDQLKQALQTLREARKENQQTLAKAQQELREVVTLKQEAILVMMGMLD